MNEKIFRALVEAGAVKDINIVADGSRFHVRINTINGSATASTVKGGVKTWGSLDSAAKWVRTMGIGKASVDIVHWQPGQRGMNI